VRTHWPGQPNTGELSHPIIRRAGFPACRFSTGRLENLPCTPLIQQHCPTPRLSHSPEAGERKPARSRCGSNTVFMVNSQNLRIPLGKPFLLLLRAATGISAATGNDGRLKHSLEVARFLLRICVGSCGNHHRSMNQPRMHPAATSGRLPPTGSSTKMARCRAAHWRQLQVVLAMPVCSLSWGVTTKSTKDTKVEPYERLERVLRMQP
jgi:hypothetical protein